MRRGKWIDDGLQALFVLLLLAGCVWLTAWMLAEIMR